MSWRERVRELKAARGSTDESDGSPSVGSVTAPPAPFWTREEEAQVRACCSRLGFEPDEARTVLTACREHADARAAWLERAGEVLVHPEPARPSAAPLVRCGDCQHFRPDAVGNGAGIGRCAVPDAEGVRRGPCLWPWAVRRCGESEGCQRPWVASCCRSGTASPSEL